MKSFVSIMAVCCLVTGCAATQPMPVNQTLAAMEEEQMLWRRALEEQDTLNGSGLLYQDAEIENYLNQIAEKLQINSISPDISFQIKVIKDPNLNAFAYPNGVIYIHTGILARMDNEAQLAALLAHEMVHCTHRHSLRALRSIKDRIPPKTAAFQKLAQLIGITGAMTSISGYTRELEIEADRVGLDLAVKAKYDPGEAVKLFELLKQEIEIERIKEPYFFGTHPNVQQRIENINNWLAEKYQRKITGFRNTDVFQARLSRLVLDNARLDLRQGRFLIAQRSVEKYQNLRSRCH